MLYSSAAVIAVGDSVVQLYCYIAVGDRVVQCYICNGCR